MRPGVGVVKDRPPMPPPVGTRVRCLMGRNRLRVGVVDEWFGPSKADASRNAGDDDGPCGGMFWAWFGDRHRATSPTFEGLPARYCYRPDEVEILEDR